MATDKPLARWIWIGAAAAIAVIVIWALWPRGIEVSVAVIDRGLVRDEVVDEGRTRIHDVFVVAAPVSGRLNRVEVEPGDAVTRGQNVAVISPADPALLDARTAAQLDAAVNAAAAAVALAEAELSLAQRDRARIAALAEQDFAAPAALDAANAAYRAARAALAARRAEQTRARAAASTSGGRRATTSTRVRAPTSGRVLRVLQESETVVIAGTALLEIGDPSHVEIIAEFLSQDAVDLRVGANAFIENWGGEASLPAIVTRIEPYARTKISALGVEEQRVNVILHLRDPDSAPPFGQGFRVDARAIRAERENALRVPTDALVRDGAQWAVFLIVHGRATLTPVALGIGNSRYREVTRGLNADDQVILFPPDTLDNGAAVSPRAE